MQITERLGENIFNKLFTFNPYSHTMALCRTALAFGTLITLLFNDTGVLFRPIVGSPDIPSCIGASKLSLFCMLSNNLEIARWISIISLTIVISGLYPMITGILHWWISFSLITTATIVDGGDQVASVLTLLLIPICLIDKRRNHWHLVSHDHTLTRKLIAYSTIQIIKIQVAFIYFQACVSKFAVPEWVDGTAVYYWFLNPMFGVTSESKTLVVSMLSNPFVVVAITWSALALEFLIFIMIAIRQDQPIKKYVLVGALGFHFLIMSIHGLVSFFFSMAGALLIYLLPHNFSLNNFKRKPITSA